MTNEQLCSLAQEGDHSAETTLVENILPSIQLTAAQIKERYPGLMLERDDLIQEALIGSMRAIESFDPESGNLFQTYASAVAENAIYDYVRKCISALPPSGRILSLDAPAPGTDPENNVTYAEIIPDDFSKNPEQLFIKKETITEVRDALQMITERERTYLHYRYGFMDDLPHDQTETAAHFHLSLSRAKSTESTALDNVRLELPWWY